MFVILVVATDATRRLGKFVANRVLMAPDAFDILVLPVQLEFGLVVIKIPPLPVTGVMTSVTSLSERAFMHVLLLVTRPAIRLGLFEYHG